jgi:hypothetical protein
MPEKMIKLPLRYYLNSQIYGPGMPPTGEEGLHEEVIGKPVNQVGLVLVHCWNCGEEDGPYPIKPGTRISGKAGDWVPLAHDIVHTEIKPVLEACRQAGIAVFHLGQAVYAPRYESYLRIKNDAELQDPTTCGKYDMCVRPRSVKELWDYEFGTDFPGPAWVTHEDRFDIAEPVKPIGDEPVFLTGFQLNGLCRRQDIDMLFYVGFMAGGCMLNQPGAIREMAGKFRYRCVMLREGTIHYEDEKTMKDRWMTYAAYREVEMQHGFTASTRDLLRALI